MSAKPAINACHLLRQLIILVVGLLLGRSEVLIRLVDRFQIGGESSLAPTKLLQRLNARAAR